MCRTLSRVRRPSGSEDTVFLVYSFLVLLPYKHGTKNTWWMTGMLISPAVETHFLQLRKEEMARAATKKDSWHNNNNINIINNNNKL